MMFGKKRSPIKSEEIGTAPPSQIVQLINPSGVRRLQSEIADRDTKIAELRGEIQQLRAELQMSKAALDGARAQADEKRISESRVEIEKECEARYANQIADLKRQIDEARDAATDCLAGQGLTPDQLPGGMATQLGGGAFLTYQRLVTSGKSKEAAEYYHKHADAINASRPKQN